MVQHSTTTAAATPTASLGHKAAHFVSDLTTVILNPISDKPSKTREDRDKSQESIVEDDTDPTVNGPDTSSFTAFLYSLLSASESENDSNAEDHNQIQNDASKLVSEPGSVDSSSRKKSFFSRGKHFIGKTIYQGVRTNGHNAKHNDPCQHGLELGKLQLSEESMSRICLPDISEASLLLSEKTRSSLYASLPVVVQGKKWYLLYSTWRHGISLSTLYRRSMIFPGFCLLVVGDRKGTIFGGLVEAPLRPTNNKYQGTHNTFVFTNTSGMPVVYRPTGVNRYFTLCSTDFLALGGGGHFALYLDGDLLSGSSSVSDTFGNPCLAHSEDFDIKEVEVWSFNAPKYAESSSFWRTEEPEICR